MRNIRQTQETRELEWGINQSKKKTQNFVALLLRLFSHPSSWGERTTTDEWSWIPWERRSTWKGTQDKSIKAGVESERETMNHVFRLASSSLNVLWKRARSSRHKQRSWVEACVSHFALASLSRHVSAWGQSSSEGKCCSTSKRWCLEDLSESFFCLLLLCFFAFLRVRFDRESHTSAARKCD